MTDYTQLPDVVYYQAVFTRHASISALAQNDAWLMGIMTGSTNNGVIGAKRKRNIEFFLKVFLFSDHSISHTFSDPESSLLAGHSMAE